MIKQHNLKFINKKDKMTQQNKGKSILKQVVDIFSKTSPYVLAVGLVAGVAIATKLVKLMSLSIHPDSKKVLQLKNIIQKSYPDALQSLQTLNIQKRIHTEYGNQKEGSNQTSELNMLYLVMSRLKIKELNKQKQLRNPFLPPFQDGLFISELQPTHRLLYNKYNIFKDHLLVVTKQFETQSSQVSESDLRQSILVMRAIQGLMFFNSGPQSGSSQPHKHLQIFPIDSPDLPIIKQIMSFVKLKSKTYDYEGQPIIEYTAYNFIHGLIILKSQVSISSSRKKMYTAYKKIMEKRVKSIQAVAYNILATELFILIIPRCKQKAFDQISINAIGFMGSLLFKEQEKLNKYLSLKIKPSSILQDITYPKNYSIS